jgi:uncharacterized membrane protein
MSTVRQIAAVVAATGAGVSTGVFFTFSDFGMRALRALPERSGLAAMQAVNRAAPSPLFMTTLFGPAAIVAWLGVTATYRRDEPQSLYELAGAMLYLTAIGLTVAYHVPQNDRLARLDPLSPAADAAWRSYAAAWTRWNHVRVLTSLGATAALIGAATSR